MRFVTIVISLLIISGFIIVNFANNPLQGGEIAANVGGIAPAPVDISQFERAYEVKPIRFPQDLGPHPAYQTEWWYYTGNLAEEETGARYGFQLTFFRRSLAPQVREGESEWGSNQLYFAHFAITDAENEAFYPQERFSRGAAALAGAQSKPYRVWLENWEVRELETGLIRLHAATDQVTLSLDIAPLKPATLQGDQGFSPKSDEPGNASYYYSLTRNQATGQVTTPAGQATVNGLVWVDHEWSTSALGAEAVGWDWFSLQLDDGREVMYFQIRLEDGGIEPISEGVLIEADGTKRPFGPSEVEITVLDDWVSPQTGASYPAQWHFVLPDFNLDLTLTPLIPNQELLASSIYWEGAIHIEGSHTGYGYIELTGYHQSMNGRF